MTNLILYITITVLFISLVNSATELLKSRESKFQLSLGAISINSPIHAREKRQNQDYGRNPPSSLEYQPTQTQSFNPLQQRPTLNSNTFQNTVSSPVISSQRSTIVSQSPQQPIRQRQNFQGTNTNFQPASPPGINPRRPNGRRGSRTRFNDVQNPTSVSGDVKATRYYYPPRMPLPLPVCFYNPTGYVCCNKQLNDLIVDTYTELEARPKFHTCNINAIATQLQMKAETRFNTSFETIAGFEDFAQKIHFNGDLACKVELGGKYMLAYGTVKNADEHLAPEDSMGPHNEVPRHHISKRTSAFF